MKIFVYIYLFFLLISCSNSRYEKITDDLFLQEIKDTHVELKSVGEFYVDAGFTHLPHQMAIDNSGRLVIVEGRTWKIYLSDEQGNYITETGGLGRGPGEFLGVNDIYITDDNELYIMDLNLQRITRFYIAEKEIHYKETVNLEQTNHGNLQEIFSHNQQWYGIYRSYRAGASGTWKLQLYALDASFKPEKHLLEMEGHKRVRLGRGGDDDLLSATTVWDVQDGWFYFARTDQLNVEMFNLITGKRKTVPISGFFKRPNHTSARVYFEERMEIPIMLYPQLSDLIKDKETLPIFSELIVDGENIWFLVFYAGNSKGHMLSVNKHSGKIQWMEVSPNIHRLQMYKNKLYGIDYYDPDYLEPEITVITLS